jgi:N-acetylmuramoyl-L-alanine amidase
MAHPHRIKKRLIREAVEENLETIRGLAPRNLRPGARRARLWARRAFFLAVPFTLVGSTFIFSSRGDESARLHGVMSQSALASMVQRRNQAAEVPTTFMAPHERIDPAALPLEVRRIVIDAGHGGHDIGTSDPTGVVEKALTLEIGDRLRRLLEQEHFAVSLTRSGDETLTLQQRANMANQAGGDLFVSIHLNWLRNPNNRGVETYYLGPTNDPVLNQLAAAENRESGYSMSDMRRLLDGIYADVRQDESKKLAESIQQQLFNSLRTSNPRIANRGVKTAPFVVLVATDMPAVLAEVSCLSNREEVELLKQDAYKQKIAEALFAGIKAYASHRDLTQKGT